MALPSPSSQTEILNQIIRGNFKSSGANDFPKKVTAKHQPWAIQICESITFICLLSTLTEQPQRARNMNQILSDFSNPWGRTIFRKSDSQTLALGCRNVRDHHLVSNPLRASKNRGFLNFGRFLHRFARSLSLAPKGQARLCDRSARPRRGGLRPGRRQESLLLLLPLPFPFCIFSPSLLCTVPLPLFCTLFPSPLLPNPKPSLLYPLPISILSQPRKTIHLAPQG